jgi:hypothetical protein
VLASVPVIPPLLYACFSDSNRFAENLYPPLGDLQQIAVTSTVGFLLLATFLVFIVCPLTRRRRKVVVMALAAGAVVGAAVLIALCGLYVRQIRVPSIDAVVPISIGYRQTDFAHRVYPKPRWDDRSMLHDRGPTEETIQTLWTHNSVLVVRGLLWASYTFTLVFFLSIMSLAVYQHAAEDSSNP